MANREGFSLYEVIKTLAFTPNTGGRMGIPCNFEGPPGTGKSSILQALGITTGLFVETLMTSLMEPVDIGGYRVPDAASGYLKLYPPEYVQRLHEQEKAGNGQLLFFDELNCAASKSNLDAALRIVQDLAVGAVPLPKNCRVFAAMNPAHMTHAGHEIGPALANRFVNLVTTQEDTGSVQEWLDGLMSGFNDGLKLEEPAADIEKRVLAQWPTVYAQYKGVVAGFIKANRSMLYAMPGADDPSSAKGWPSKRSNALVPRLLAGCDIHGNTDDEEMRILEGAIGAGAAAQLMSYRDNTDLPDTAKLLDGKEQWQHNPERIDVTVAVLASGVSLVLDDNCANHEQRVSSLWNVMGNVVNDDLAQDVLIGPSRKLSRKGLWTPDAIKISAKLKALVDTVGVD